MFKWSSGRINYSYKILTLIKFKKFDCYLINILKNCKIPLHKDKIEGYKHYRINILLKGKYVQIYGERPIFINRFITIFRPDINEHMAGTANNEATIFSIGFLKKENK